LDKCFEHSLTKVLVDTAQALNLFRPECQTRHFEVFSAYALQNVRNGRLVHGIPALKWKIGVVMARFSRLALGDYVISPVSNK
jgi:hypothetical protein